MTFESLNRTGIAMSDYVIRFNKQCIPPKKYKLHSETFHVLLHVYEEHFWSEWG